MYAHPIVHIRDAGIIRIRKKYIGICKTVIEYRTFMTTGCACVIKKRT